MSIFKMVKRSARLVLMKTNKILYDLFVYYVKEMDSMLPCPVSREFKKLRRQLPQKRHIKIELSDYSMLITLYKIGEPRFRLLGTNGFHVKAENESFTAASWRCRENLKYEIFTSSFGRLLRLKHCTKKRAARAARLFFFIEPIKSLICGVVVDVAVVYLKLPSVKSRKTSKYGRHISDTRLLPFALTKG